MGRKSDLDVVVEDGVLKITIGVDTLKYAIEASPTFDDDNIKVTDADVFAQAVLDELLQEDEEGTTLVHIMLDGAANQAVENGAEGFTIGSDMESDDSVYDD